MRNGGRPAGAGAGGGAVDRSNLHLKKELTQIRKAARVLRDPGTTSSCWSPRNSSRSLAKNHYVHGNGGTASRSEQIPRLPLHGENGKLYSHSNSVNKNDNVNVVKREKKVFLYNWRSQKSESEWSRQNGEYDVENAKDERSSSTLEDRMNVDSSSDSRNAGVNDSKSDTCCLSDRHASVIFNCEDTSFARPIRRKVRNSKSSLRQGVKHLKKGNLQRSAKYAVQGMSGLGLGQDDVVNSVDKSDDSDDYCNSDNLRRESAISPLLNRLQRKDWDHSPTKFLKRPGKEDVSISHLTPTVSTSYKYGIRNQSIVESWDATTASFNDADDEVDDGLDLPGGPGCGIACYWSKRSITKFRGNGSFSPSLSDTLRRKGSGIFCGSRTLYEKRHDRPSLVSNKRRLRSGHFAKHLVPMLGSSADDQGESSPGSGKTDHELSTNFGELDLEATSRLDGRRWSTSCRYGEGLELVTVNEEMLEENSPENTKSLSQKYRPMFFEELLGQNMIMQSLMSAISKGRIAPVYLLQGPRGTGKTSTARIFAAALNCLATEESKPCGVCRECAGFISGKSKHHTEVDVSNKRGIYSVKSIFRNLMLVSSTGSLPYKVFVIDECHLLPSKAWLAFLQFIEKPLPRVVFILITTDGENLPRTILSRCQKQVFNKISNSDIFTRLRKIASEENLDIEADALDLIALNADGSLQEAETILEQLSLLGKPVTTSLVNELIGVVSDEKLLDLLELAMSSNTTETVIKARELMDSGVDPIVLMSQLAALIVDIIAGNYPKVDAKINKSFFGGRSLSERELNKLKQALMLLSESEKHLRVSSEQSTWFTATLLQLGSVPSPDPNLSVSSRRQSFNTPEEQHTRTLRESIVQKLRSDAVNSKPGQSIEDEALITRNNDVMSGKAKSGRINSNTLTDIWMQCVEKCHSRTLRHLLHTYGKLMSISEVQGGFVAYIAFADNNAKTRAEGFLSSIMDSFEMVLRCNVEVKILLLLDSCSQKQMKAIVPMKQENKSICSSAIKDNSNLDSRQKTSKVSKGSFNGSRSHQIGPSDGSDRLQRIESIIRKQRLEAARLQGMEKGTSGSGSTNRLRHERNQVLPQDGLCQQRNMESASMALSFKLSEEDLNSEIRALKINERTEFQLDSVAKRISPYPISPSLLHHSSFSTNFSKDSMGYESGSAGGGCSGFFCWNNSRPHRRGKKAKQGITLTGRSRSRRFSCFGECAKSRRTHNRYRR